MSTVSLVQSARVRASKFRPSAGLLSIAAIAAAAFILSVSQGSYILVNTMVTGAMWGLMAVGLSLLYGVMNMPSFALGEYFMLGSFGAYFIYYIFVPATGQNLDAGPLVPVLAIAGGTLVGTIAGALTDVLLLRPLRSRTKENWTLYAFVLTLGISVVLQNGALMTLGPNFHGIPWYWAGTVQIAGVQVATDRVAAIVIGLTAMVGLGYLINYTSIGRTLRAVSQDEVGAQLLGIDIASVHLFTYTLSCLLAALAGASLLFLFPAWPLSGGPPLFTAWTVVILAGLGTIGGAVAGGFVIAFVQTVTDNYLGANYQFVVPSVVIIVILLLRPQGLFGSKTSKLAWD